MHIVDRRLNPGGKSLANRQRFMRRAKSLIRKAVHESSANRSIKDADKGGEVSLPGAGRARAVVPPRRNRRHPRPPAAGQQGICRRRHDPAPAGRRRRAAARRAARTARGRTISASPCRTTSSSICSWKTWNCPTSPSAGSRTPRSVSWHRAGYSVSGSPANLALMRTVRNSLSRRIALQAAEARRDRGACAHEIEALETGRRRSARRVGRSCGSELDRAAAPHQPDPLYRPAGRALPALRVACRSRWPRR